MTTGKTTSRCLWLACVLCMATPLSAIAQDAARSAGPATSAPGPDRERVLKLLELTGAASIGEQFAVATAMQLIHMIAQANPTAPDTVFELVREATFAFLHQAVRDPGGLLPRLADIYAHHLTEEEVEGLIAFYESPLGAEIRRKRPQITAEGIAAAEEWGRQTGPDLQAAIAARMNPGLPRTGGMLVLSLQTLQKFRYLYVFVEHPETGQFVQFAAAEGGGFLMDVPSQPLTEAELKAGIAFFEALGMDALHETAAIDPETGRQVGTQVSLQVILPPDPGKAARLTRQFFADVFGADESVELVVRTD